MPTSEKDLQPVRLFVKDQNEANFRKVREALSQLFPVETTRYKVEMSNISVDKGFETNFAETKDAVLKRSSLTIPIHATITLKTLDGKVLDSLTNHRIMSMPLLTPLRTFILDGTQYATTNQMRLRPGIYTKRAESGETVAFFNMGKGGSFRLQLEPETGIFYWVIGTAKKSLPVYPILRAFGIQDSQIVSAWGQKLLDENRKQTDLKRSATISTLYDKLLFTTEKKTPASSEQEQVKAIMKMFAERTELDPETTKSTLGESYTTLTPLAILAATKKMIGVYQGKILEDERDSLEYKKLVTIDDFFKEVLLKERGKKVINKIKSNLNVTSGVPSLTKIFQPGIFTSAITNFLTTESLSGNPDQINPVEILDQANKITSLGPGGIPSLQSITNIQRLVHPSHVGILDPIRTPENEKAGIDIRLVNSAARDSQGKLYAPLRDVKTGKISYYHPSESKNLHIAFEDPRGKKDIEVLHNGEVSRMAASKATHYVPYVETKYSDSTNLLPFLGNMQGNRAIMGSKQVTQALPLVNSEVPLVQSKSDYFGTSHDMSIGSNILPKSPIDGIVKSVSKDAIVIIGSDKNKEVITIHLANYLPLNSKTYLHNTVFSHVVPGYKVKKGEILADNNFTKNKTLALGTNLQVAYMPYHGLVHEDAVVISDSASKKLTSTHMYRKSIDITKEITLSKTKYRTFYSNHFTNESYDKLDEFGVIKRGSIVHYGEPIILALRKSHATSTDVLLGKLHRSFNNPFKDASITWDKQVPGEIIDVKATRSTVVVTVKTDTPASEGDKLGGRYGNKGVIAKIVPDDQMPHTQDNKAIDVLMTPVGVISRVNPGQILETAVSKVAEKTGKPLLIDNFDGQDKVQWAKTLLKKHGLTDKETVTDMVTGKEIPGVMTGKQFLMKLHKTVDTNFSARSTGGYDADQQPVKGGETGSKGLGMMEINVLLAHNARNILKEIATIKSQKNDDYWNAVKMGKPLPTPKDNFAYNKFMGMIKGMNVSVNRNNSYLSFAPMTDADVAKTSSGAITSPLQVKSKNLMPEKDGLFDFGKTGGVTGSKWSHIDLEEPIVNPLFEEPVQRLLGFKRKEDFQKAKLDNGGAWFKRELSKLNLDKKEAELKTAISKLKGSALDDSIKQLKYIQALKENNLNPANAYVISKIPVIPPNMRPIQVSQATGSLMVPGANLLYRDLLLFNSTLKSVKASKLPDKEVKQARGALLSSVEALQGLTTPNSPQLRNKGIQGFLATMTGGEGRQPKEGYIQSTLLSRNADFTGRGTASPDPNLMIDQIGVPIDQAWTMYEPFIIRQFTLRGYDTLSAEEQIKKRTDLAKKFLEDEIKSRPVLINRAPSLWRSNIVAAYPKLISGKVLKVQSMMEEGMNLDYDGDAITLHVPVEPKAVEEARKMTIRTNFFSDKSKDDLLVKPTQEPVVGLWSATKPVTNKATKTFATKEDAWKAYSTGKLSLNDPIEIKSKLSKTASIESKVLGPFATGLAAGTLATGTGAYFLNSREKRLHKNDVRALLERDDSLSHAAGIPSVLDESERIMKEHPGVPKIKTPVDIKKTL